MVDGRTWELDVRLEKPINVDDLNIRIVQGKGLDWPPERGHLENISDAQWDNFSDQRFHLNKGDLEEAIREGDDARALKIMAHIKGISSMYRYNSGYFNGTLHLNLGVTNFQQYIGTTQQALENESVRMLLMESGLEDTGIPHHYFANPLAQCANFVTPDGFVPLGMRSKNVAIYPSVPHVIGGYVRIKNPEDPNFTVQDVNLPENIFTEVSQETGISDEHIEAVDFLGIARNRVTFGPEMMYNFSLRVSAEGFGDMWREASDRFEHRDLTFYHAEEIPNILEQFEGYMVPSGEATISLFKKHYLD
jgi:hypothetical protein